ncbi:MAG: phenylalanine--tRNA ligase subunit beta, partial [Fimbriimonas ginsengisoli]|nr:phenylalanine--tRNA ligase subunit beta [Fimbriimonas ginsengisoli]
MKLPYRMLLDFVETKLDASQTGDLLTMAGFELEELETVEGEPVLNVKVMSNRGDGLSAFGLAREVLAKEPHATPTILYERASARFAEAGAPPEGGEGLVTIETPDCCRYACLLFAGVANGDAPDWIKKRLRQAGMRPISLLVDLSNYVMLELGQPMHAFDLAKLEGGRIVVRGARKGEKLTTLDGVERELAPGQMMICDARRLVAAAGIMGGLDTEVSARTSQVLLESAHFDAGSVRRTRKQLGLSTEASYRFERSVDPEGVVAALNRFAQLLSESGSPASSSGLVDVYPGRHDPLSIELSLSQANRLLGMDIEPAQAKSYLENLGFQVSGDGEPLIETPPSWRPDVVRECDVIEELGRVHGYEKIPECLPHGATVQGG